MKETKDLKVGDKAVLITYRGPLSVTVKKVGTKYLYVTRTDSRFDREDGTCPDSKSQCLLSIEQREENVQAARRTYALQHWGIVLKPPYDKEKIRKVYEALLPVFGGERPISNAG